MTEAEVTRQIMDKIYSAHEQIHEETKHLSADEYIAYFGDHARAIIERNGYLAVRSKDALGYTLQKLHD